MNDKPFPEDLISGHLDDQLTPGQRAELEEALRDPELGSLVSALGAQSDQLRALPKYELGSNFADRLLTDERVAEVFADGEQAVVSPKGVVENSGRVRLPAAAAAIASLAALVLIGLFLSLPSFTSSEVAQKRVGVEFDEATDSLALEGNLEGVSDNPPGLTTAEPVNDSFKLDVVESELLGVNEEEAVVMSKEQQNRKDMAKAERFVSPNVARGRAQKMRVPSTGPEESDSYSPGFADAVDAKPMSNSRGGGKAKPFGADAVKLKQMRSSGGKLAEEKRESRFSDAEDLVAGSGGVGGGGVGGGGGRGGRPGRSKKDAIKESVVDAGSLGDVLEVSFGSDASPLEKFKEVLERNSFQIEMAQVPDLKQVEDMARADADDDFAGTAAQDRGDDAAVVFEVVATAQQMAEFVTDLDRSASVFHLSQESLGLEAGMQEELADEVHELEVLKRGLRGEGMVEAGRSLKLNADTAGGNDKSNGVVSRGVAKLADRQKASEVLGRKLRPTGQLGEGGNVTARYYRYFSKHSSGKAPAKYLFIVRRTRFQRPADVRDAESVPVDREDN